jgi:O-succinylbenzoate synthase
MPVETAEAAAAVRVPLTTRFRATTARDALLLRGPAGWGEFSPFSDYPPQRAARWLAAAREAAAGEWPTARRKSVPVNATVPAVDPDTAHAWVARSGCGTAKVKVAETGQTLADDLARCEAVRDALGPRGALRVDANGAWAVDAAAAALISLERFELEYAEQPVATLTEMAELRRRVDTRLAADESVRTADDPLRVAGLEAADVVVLKAAPLGGVAAALEVAEACGLDAVVSSAMETSVGLAAGVALAAALPHLPYACGLGTAALLADDVTADPLAPVEGAVAVRRVAPEAAPLARLAADAETAAALYRAHEAAAAVLDGGASA